MVFTGVSVLTVCSPMVIVLMVITVLTVGSPMVMMLMVEMQLTVRNPIVIGLTGIIVQTVKAQWQGCSWLQSC